MFAGGFDGTSNVLAGKMFKIPVRGTHAHSFVTSYSSLADVQARPLRHAERGAPVDLLAAALAGRAAAARVLDVAPDEASDGELAALVSYAQAFPSGFLALVDTYDVKRYNTRGRRRNGRADYNSNCGSNGRSIRNLSPPRGARGCSTFERTLR